MLTKIEHIHFFIRWDYFKNSCRYCRKSRYLKSALKTPQKDLKLVRINFILTPKNIVKNSLLQNLISNIYLTYTPYAERKHSCPALKILCKWYVAFREIMGHFCWTVLLVEGWHALIFKQRTGKSYREDLLNRERSVWTLGKSNHIRENPSQRDLALGNRERNAWKKATISDKNVNPT